MTKKLIQDFQLFEQRKLQLVYLNQYLIRSQNIQSPPKNQYTAISTKRGRK